MTTMTPTNWRPLPPRCPRCRELGLLVDCTDPKGHGGRGQRRMTNYDDDGTVELEVTLKFPVPVSTDIEFGARELAMRMAERWSADPDELIDVVTEAIRDDYYLQVRPSFMDE